MILIASHSFRVASYRTLVPNALFDAGEVCVFISCVVGYADSLAHAIVALTIEFDLDGVDHEEKIKELHELLESLMQRRLKRDVLTELPTKSERILRVEMSALQTQFYKNTLTKARTSSLNTLASFLM
jgi:SNF2-related domain